MTIEEINNLERESLKRQLKHLNDARNNLTWKQELNMYIDKIESEAIESKDRIINRLDKMRIVLNSKI